MAGHGGCTGSAHACERQSGERVRGTGTVCTSRAVFFARKVEWAARASLRADAEAAAAGGALAALAGAGGTAASSGLPHARCSSAQTLAISELNA
jgi:hypothetical protein